MRPSLQEGNTALYYAISNGMDSTIDQLLRAGAKPDATGRGGNSAAHFAADAGRCNALKRLAQESADFNILNWVRQLPHHSCILYARTGRIGSIDFLTKPK